VLADDFFRLAHDDTSGRPRLHTRAVAIGLAAALLGELVSARRIVFDRSEVIVADRTPPDDPVAHTVLDTVRRERQRHTVRIWLDFLATSSREQVAGRLLRAGQVHEVTSRRLLRPTVTRYVPTDMNRAAAPAVLLSTRRRSREPIDYDTACLAGLTAATGLDDFILESASAPPPTICGTS
jgi:hypothetical protein